MATTKKAPTPKGKLSGTIQVNVTRQIQAKTLHNLLDEIFKQHGCLTCGLGGIDILIRPRDIILPNIHKEILEVNIG